MSYHKLFAAASAAIAAEQVRSFTDLPVHVRSFASGEIARLKETPGFYLKVMLTGHSPHGTAPYEQASCKLETEWVAILGAPSMPVDEPAVSVRDIPRVGGGRPLADRPDVEVVEDDAGVVTLAAEDDPADGA